MNHPARLRRRATWLRLSRLLWAYLAAVRLRCSRACALTAAALAVAVALLAAGCGASSSVPGTLGPGTTVFKAGSGPPVPAITGPLVGAGKLSLASYRGHVVVLNFWGSWCSVCREEAPNLAAAALHFKSSGVRFLGVDVEDNPASALAYMRHFRIAYPSLNDSGDKIAHDTHCGFPQHLGHLSQWPGRCPGHRRRHLPRADPHHQRSDGPVQITKARLQARNRWTPTGPGPLLQGCKRVGSCLQATMQPRHRAAADFDGLPQLSRAARHASRPAATIRQLVNVRYARARYVPDGAANEFAVKDEPSIQVLAQLHTAGRASRPANEGAAGAPMVSSDRPATMTNPTTRLRTARRTPPCATHVPHTTAIQGDSWPPASQ